MRCKQCNIKTLNVNTIDANPPKNNTLYLCPKCGEYCKEKNK